MRCGATDVHNLISSPETEPRMVLAESASIAINFSNGISLVEKILKVSRYRYSLVDDYTLIDPRCPTTFSSLGL